MLTLLSLLLGSGAALALDTGDILVASTKGEVHFVVNGTERALRAGSKLELPATVRTGRDGAVELRQGATSISVGPETLLEFPALATPGGAIDRVVQPKGNAFYDIGKRQGRKLRVETPFLVGVVKGTQFNVAAQDHATTISLYEGLLEIRTPDDSDVADLHAGEIARRDRGAADISVLKMDTKVPTAPKPQSGAGGGNGAPVPSPPRPSPETIVGEPQFAERDTRPVAAPPVVASPVTGDSIVSETLTDANASASAETRPETNVPADNGANVDVAVNSPAGSAASVDVGVNTPVDTGASVSVAVESPAAAVGANVDVVVETPAAAIGANVDVAVETPAAAVDANVDVAVEAPAAAVSTNVDVAVATPVVDVGASVDLGVSLPADTGGAASPDLGVSADVAANAGAAASVDVNANAQAGPLANGEGAGVAVNVGADVGPANVDLGVNANGNGVTVDTGVDLGLGNDANGNNGNANGIGNGNGVGNGLVETVTDTVAAPAVDVVEDVTNLLDGLTRRPGKK